MCAAIKHENACEFACVEPMESIEQPEPNENVDFETKFLPEHNEYPDTAESIECVNVDEMLIEPVEPIIRDHEDKEDNTLNKIAQSASSRTRKREGRFDSCYCLECNRTFKSKSTMKTHYFTVHNNVMNTESTVLECDECARPFKGAQALKTHKRTMHSNEVQNTNTFKCDTCNETFAYVMQLAKHLKEHTDLNQHKCPLCYRSFISYDEYYFHVYEHPYSRAIATEQQIQHPFACTSCTQVTRSSLTLILHMQTHADLTEFGCIYHNCDEDFSSYDELYRHVLEHRQNEFIKKNANPIQPSKTASYPHIRVTCDICSKTFYDKSSITKHMKAKHIPKDPIQQATYRCELCLLQYDNRLRLESHVRDYHVKTNRILVHRHKCCSCSQSFRYITPLLEHLVTHTDLTEYTCQLNGCGHKVTEIDALRRHLKAHTKKSRQPPCTKCNQIMESTTHVCQLTDLPVPERNKYQPYSKICDHCGAKFCSVSDLRYHMNSVNGIKPYKCEFCEKAFARPAFRRVHQRSHTGEKFYKCKQSDCDSAYMDFRQLTRHEWRAHDLYRRRYPCTVCNKVFPDQQLLRRHAKEHNVFTSNVKAPAKKRKRK